MPLGKKFFRGRLPFGHVPPAHVLHGRVPRAQVRHAQAPHAQAPRGYVPPDATANADAAPAPALLPSRMPLKVRRIETRLALVRAARPQSASATQVPRKTILSAGLHLTHKAVAWCAVHADLAFVNFPAAIFSWLLTQFFVGCAAYAEAMYPNFGHVHASEAGASKVGASQVAASRVAASEDADRRDPLQNMEAQRGDCGAGNSSGSPSLAPDLAELSRFAIGAGGRRPQGPHAGRTRSNWTKSGGTGNIVWLNAIRPARPGRLGSLAQTVAAWLSRRRQGGNRRVTVGLGNHDRRARQEVWMARYGIE
jgi:hypothetical protein